MSQTATCPDTGTAAEVGVPRIFLLDITESGTIVSEDNKPLVQKRKQIQVKSCKVNVVDVLKDHMFAPTDCTISKWGNKNGETCKILITDKQTRESTEICSKSIVQKNNDKFGKRIGLNKYNICKFQIHFLATSPNVLLRHIASTSSLSNLPTYYTPLNVVFV